MADIGAWGLMGAFFAELGNSAVILLPTPGPAYTFAMGATLNPFLLGLAGGVGAALGELTGYFLGTRGRHIVERWSPFARLTAATSRWTGPMLFVLAALPIPFDIAGVWAGSTRYPLSRFLLFVTPGKIIKGPSSGLPDTTASARCSAPWAKNLRSAVGHRTPVLRHPPQPAFSPRWTHPLLAAMSLRYPSHSPSASG